jgi:gamma-tubulin complex component 3
MTLVQPNLSFQPEIRNRPAVLSFLYQLSDSKTDTVKLERDVFTSERKLPPQKSTSMDCIEKMLPGLMRPHSAIPSTSSSESNLKMVQFQRKKCTSSLTSMSTALDESEEERASKTLNEELVQDVIYALTGIQGKYLRKDVITGKFKLDPKVKHLSLCDVQMMLRLAGVGQLHEEVKKFTDPTSGSFLYGLLGQGLVSAYQKELTQYYGMVAMLQTQLNRQKSESVHEWTAESLSLLKVMLWVTEPMYRMQTLMTIGAACKDLKGGALASAVYQFFYSGDPGVKTLVRELLLAVCIPLQQMLSVWLLDGEIEDKHGEFFIEELPEVGSDRIWHEKYRLRKNMVPSFIPQ